jgi:hypothetical protein
MRALKAIGFVLGVSALQFFLFFLGIMMGGAGHGSVFFAEVLLAPFSLSETQALWGLLIWPVVGTLLVFRRLRACRIAAATVLVVHYVGIGMVSLRAEWEYVGKTFSALFPIVLVVVAGYLGGQVFLWSLICRSSPPALDRIAPDPNAGS